MHPAQQQSHDHQHQQQHQRLHPAQFHQVHRDNVSDGQLIRTLTRTLTAAGGERAKTEESGGHLDEELLQKQMLSDPRFGSPLLCDAAVMLLALVPLFCGLKDFVATKPANYPRNTATNNTSSLSGYHYGLALCGIFIFLLGLRSASIHLTSHRDSTEEHVLHILDKFGGSLWIPKLPDVTQIDPAASFTSGGSAPSQSTLSHVASGLLLQQEQRQQQQRQTPSSDRDGQQSLVQLQQQQQRGTSIRCLMLDRSSSSVFQLSELKPVEAAPASETLKSETGASGPRGRQVTIARSPL